jgi:hypothetical protein
MAKPALTQSSTVNRLVAAFERSIAIAAHPTDIGSARGDLNASNLTAPSWEIRLRKGHEATAGVSPVLVNVFYSTAHN